MDSIRITQIDTTDVLYPQVWELREEILRKPIGLSLKNEDLSGDKEDIILIATENDTVIGCLMLHTVDENKLKLRQMAVYENRQGQGVGRKLMNVAEHFAAQKGFKKLVLHARTVALGFYEKLGYEIASGEFEEVGVPHFVMERSL